MNSEFNKKSVNNNERKTVYFEWYVILSPSPPPSPHHCFDYVFLYNANQMATFKKQVTLSISPAKVLLRQAFDVAVCKCGLTSADRCAVRMLDVLNRKDEGEREPL